MTLFNHKRRGSIKGKLHAGLSKQFKIDYICPKTERPKTVRVIFHDTGAITAREWAEDYAYSIADKGSYRVKEIR